MPDRFIATKKHKRHKNSSQNICALCAFLWLFFLTHATDIESGSKYHREQDKDRDQYHERIEYLL